MEYNKLDDMYYECPESWYPYIDAMRLEIAELLKMYNLQMDFIVYEQIKSKFSSLRIYVSYPLIFNADDDLPYETMQLYKCVESMCTAIINKFENIVTNLWQCQLLGENDDKRTIG